MIFSTFSSPWLTFPNHRISLSKPSPRLTVRHSTHQWSPPHSWRRQTSVHIVLAPLRTTFCSPFLWTLLWRKFLTFCSCWIVEGSQWCRYDRCTSHHSRWIYGGCLVPHSWITRSMSSLLASSWSSSTANMADLRQNLPSNRCLTILITDLPILFSSLVASFCPSSPCSPRWPGATSSPWCSSSRGTLRPHASFEWSRPCLPVETWGKPPS